MATKVGRSADRERSEALSRDALIRAAVALVRADGVSALTMRRLAMATGRAPMTLYSHVPNKEQLLVLVADAVLSEIAIPAGPWDSASRDLAQSIWRKLGEAPGLAAFVWRNVPYLFSPQGLRLADASLGLLIAGGYAPPDANRAQTALMTYITGDVQRNEAPAAAPRRSIKRLLKGYPNLEAAHEPQSRPTDPTPEESFLYGLDLLLEGLRRDPRRGKARAR